MLRACWRASQTTLECLKAAAFSSFATSTAERTVKDYPISRCTRSYTNGAFLASHVQPQGSSPLSSNRRALLLGAVVGASVSYTACSWNTDAQQTLKRLALEAASSVCQWRPWRSAQLEHNPSIEAASAAHNWVKGPFLGPHFIADAAAKAAPAVVNIRVQVGEGSMARMWNGSGCIIGTDGTILTNAHLVDGVRGEQQRLAGRPSPVHVSLPDGRIFHADIKSLDRASDLAVLKITADDPLPTVSLGSSQHLRVGEWIVALGSPLHLSKSVTSGIVSCVDRKAAELGLLNVSSDYIQTDAAINSGNSGGPLVNLEGQVVGISTMKAIAADGISFAIPIDTAKEVLQQLQEHGRVLRPYCGIRMLQLTEALLPQLRAQDPAFPPITRGILVSEVAPGSPAEKAGLKSGDVITGFGEATDVTTAHLIKVLMKHINKPLTLEVRSRHGPATRLQLTASEAAAVL